MNNEFILLNQIEALEQKIRFMEIAIQKQRDEIHELKTQKAKSYYNWEPVSFTYQGHRLPKEVEIKKFFASDNIYTDRPYSSDSPEMREYQIHKIKEGLRLMLLNFLEKEGILEFRIDERRRGNIVVHTGLFIGKLEKKEVANAKY